MEAHDFLVVYGSLLATMLVCRVVPLFLLKGRALSDKVMRAIGLIPAAAFAALVANDVFSPEAFQTDPLRAMVPIVATVPVALVAVRTRSLIWSAVCGMVAYAALTLALFGTL